MAMQIAPKTKQQEEPARGGTLAPRGEFPFFLGRMRDEFDRLLERFSREWSNLWDGNGWRWGLEVRDEAGNVGTHVVSEPITLLRERPEARIRGVRPRGS